MQKHMFLFCVNVYIIIDIIMYNFIIYDSDVSLYKEPLSILDFTSVHYFSFFFVTNDIRDCNSLFNMLK